MAPLINPFKLMGKTAGASPSEIMKGKGKGETKGAGARKKLKKSITVAPGPEPATQTTTNQEPPRSLPVVHDLDESDYGEELAPRKKKGQTEATSVPAKGTSSDFEAWVPQLLFDPGPISVRDTILDDSETKLSAKVAHGLARAACLPEDMKLWDNIHSKQIFRHITRGMMMVIIFSLCIYTFFYICFCIFPFYHILFLSSFPLYLFLMLRLFKTSFLWKLGSLG